MSGSATLWTTAQQAPLCMGFSRQEYWSAWLYPPAKDLPHPGIKPEALTSPALAGGFFTTSATWEAPEWGLNRDAGVLGNRDPQRCSCKVPRATGTCWVRLWATTVTSGWPQGRKAPGPSAEFHSICFCRAQQMWGAVPSARRIPGMTVGSGKRR